MTTPRSLRLASRISRVVACISGLGIASGCGGTRDLTPPASQAKPGALSAVLVTPNANDGAVLFNIAGGPIDSITAGAAKLAGDTKGGSGLLALGPVQNGAALALVWVPDVAKAGSYSASVVQAAARGTYALQALSGYRINVTPR
jgi:hypothetical protein